MIKRLAPLVPAIFLLAACGPDVRSFDQVSEDFDHPSGAVTSETAPTVFGQAIDAQGADSGTSNVWVDGIAMGLTDLGQELATRRSNLVVDGCDVRERSDGLVVTCDGSQGLSGTLRMEGDGTADGGEFWFTFEDWCDVTADACVDGLLAFRITLDGLGTQAQRTELISTARVDFTHAGETVSVDWALRMTTTLDTASVEWLVYSDQGAGAESWVLSAEADAQGGSLSIRGRNGTYACDYGVGGETGSCTGPDGTFAW